MFSEYVSLGNNCEVAFQMRRVLGRDSASFFSWNVTSLSSLLSILRSGFGGILESDNLQNHPQKGLIYDSSHDFFLHSPFKTEDYRTEDNSAHTLEDLRLKSKYLIKKFLQIGLSEGKTAYFYKTEESANVREHLVAVRDVLRSIHSSDQFSLIVIQREAAREPQWDVDGVYNRYVKRFAPWEDATDAHVSTWDKIFREFPHDAGLHLAGY